MFLNSYIKPRENFLLRSEFNKADEEEQVRMLCCTVRCHKLISCGHACAKVCHKGECSAAGDCKEKKKVTCGCGRKKKVCRFVFKNYSLCYCS